MPKNTKNDSSKKHSKKPLAKPKASARDYQVVVRWSAEDDCFIASLPALDGCVTHGSSEEEALNNASEAAQLWLDSAHRLGHTIPKPTDQYSGRMTIRLPTSLHQRIAEEAEREGVSINQWVLTKLAG